MRCADWKGYPMKRIALVTLLSVVLLPCVSLSQIEDYTQHFSVILTDTGKNDLKLVDFQTANGHGHLVIMRLSGLWAAGSIDVYDVGTDCSIEKQDKDKYLIKFSGEYGRPVNLMISYTYDKCLRDMTMIESIITTGKPLFTQWTVLRKDGRDQVPITFLFPGIYPYIENTEIK
jgi:hypothetical protein